MALAQSRKIKVEKVTAAGHDMADGVYDLRPVRGFTEADTLEADGPRGRADRA